MSPGLISYLDSLLFGFVSGFLSLFIGGLIGVLIGLGSEYIPPVLPRTVVRRVGSKWGLILLGLLFVACVIVPLMILFAKLLTHYHYTAWGLPKNGNDWFLRLGIIIGGLLPFLLFWLAARRRV